VNKKVWNWRLWVGFALSLIALIMYPLFVLETRQVFWRSLAIFAAAGVFLATGLMRAFAEPDRYRGRVAGWVLTGLTIVMVGLVASAHYVVSKHFPAARNAPKVGQQAPQFTLVNTAGKTVSLADMLAAPIASSAVPPKGVLLVFYRGYW